MNPSELKLEIGHVLFIDIVGYSKLLITEQSELLHKLTALVRETEQFQIADQHGTLVRIATGDGMALVFRDSPEAPAQCALELSKKLETHPELQVRMGIHSGPVNEVVDVNERANITGAGINMAQRVMDCGDAGHILLSKHVADDLEQYPQWRPMLHELGECEVKHGVRVSVVNFYTDELGNPEVPAKFKQAVAAAAVTAAKAPRVKQGIRNRAAIGAILVLLALIAGFYVLSRRSASKSQSASALSSAAAIPEKSIAILPFENLSEDKTNAYFANGMRDEILSKLSGIADLKVVSRSSADRFESRPKDLAATARRLNVASLLEGSVQKAADEVLINVQLIDARADNQLWAQSYRGNFRNVFELEAQVATQVAEALNIKLAPTQARQLGKIATQSSHAHELYLRALALNARTDEQSFLQSVALLDQAVAEDEHYARAWAELANVYLTLADAYRRPVDVLPRMRDAALMAVRNDDLSASGHVWLGAVSMLYDRNYPLAKREIERAVELEPKSCAAHRWHGWYVGRIEHNYAAARAELQTAESLDPLHPWSHWFEENIAIAQGDYDGALKLARRVIEIDPHFFYDEDPIAHAHMAAGHWEDAIKRYRSLPPSSNMLPNFELAFCYAQNGQSAVARQILAQLEALQAKLYVDKFHLAAIYATLGDKGKAFGALDRAIDDRSSRASTPRFYPWLKPLFDDPRFAAAEAKAAHSAITIGEQKLEEASENLPRTL